ncbi:uncharacterized protein NESG_01817 [Nematocida ausubeli]|uniref:Uncharacterized protein n=1 Tax=Nematocida ausubeli (strain ATCC PRA-371 / ERTm2) TaxID=1913371 RepID=A0A086J113_NEMA1|nr:uncharacterized protein NESG_01817 [Nematocida ausubeli]KFG25831.1 hypothetical protein NESG_01817 [Nematocida ausubeli]
MRMRMKIMFVLGISTVLSAQQVLDYAGPEDRSTIVHGYISDEVIARTDIDQISKQLERNRMKMLAVNGKLAKHREDIDMPRKNKRIITVSSGLQDLKEKMTQNDTRITQHINKLQELAKVISDIEEEQKKRKTIETWYAGIIAREGSGALASEAPSHGTAYSDARRIEEVYQEVQTIRDLLNEEMDEKNKLLEEKMVKVRTAENLLRIVREHTEKLKERVFSQKYDQKPPKRKVPRKLTKQHHLLYKNRHLLSLQRSKAFLLNEVVDIFYGKSVKEIDAALPEIEKKLRSLLIYNYSCAKVDYRRKTKNFIDIIRSYKTDVWSENRLCMAMDRGFLSLLQMDEILDDDRLDDVLAIMYRLYNDKEPCWLTMDEFLNHFYDILNVHLILSSGNAAESDWRTKVLFYQLHGFISSITSQEDIFAICAKLDKLNTSFLEYGYYADAQLIVPDNENTEKNAYSWKYSGGIYSRIHQCMSVHDSNHASKESRLLMDLHPLLHILKEKTIPMRMVYSSNDYVEERRNVCIVEIGYEDADSVVYRTDQMTYKDACDFCNAQEINMIIDPCLLNEASILIEKYVHPCCKVHFTGLSMNADPSAAMNREVFDIIGAPGSREKQSLHDFLQNRLTASKWLWFPIVSAVGVCCAQAAILINDGSLFFTIFPIIIGTCGILRAAVIRVGLETKSVILAFNIISSGICLAMLVYFCDIFWRASDLTDYLQIIKVAYSILGGVSVLGILLTYFTKVRRYVYGRKYSISNLVKYMCYVLSITASFLVPFSYVLGSPELLGIFMGCNIGMFSSIFFYIGCAYEKMPTQLKSDKWIAADISVLGITCLSVATGLALTFVVQVEYGLLEVLPIIMGGKEVAFSLFKEKRVSYYDAMRNIASPPPESSLDRLFRNAVNILFG